MKKLAIGAGVAAAIVVLVPYAIGLWAEHGAEERRQTVAEQMPFLVLKAHRYERGWLHSHETLEYAFGGTLGGPAAAAAARAGLTVRAETDLAHGPLPGGRALGLAVARTTLSLTAGGKTLALPPFETRWDLLGDAETTLHQAAVADVPLGSGLHLASDPVEGSLRVARGGSPRDLRFRAPQLVLHAEGEGGRPPGALTLRAVAIDSHAERLLRSVYAGAGHVGLGEFSVVAGDGPALFSLRDFMIDTDSHPHGATVDLDVKLQTGAVHAGPVDLAGLRFDLGYQHLDVDALEKLTVAMRTAGGAPAAGNGLQRLRDPAAALLAHEPSLVVRDLSVATADGRAALTGWVKVHGVTAADVAPGSDGRALLAKVLVDLEFAIDNRLLDALLAARDPQGDPGSLGRTLSSLLERKYLYRTDREARSKIVLQNGELTVNNLAFDPAAMSPPPPAAAPRPRPRR